MSFYRHVIIVLFFSAVISAQSNNSQYPSYYYQNEFALSSPGAMRYGLYGADNPALLTTLDGPDLLFTWSDQNGWKSLNHWGLFAAMPYAGFNVVRENYLDQSVTDYKINFAFGDRTFGLGFGYGWSTGNESLFRRSNVITAGSFYRPNRYISAGITGSFPGNGFNEGIIDLAVRPFGNELLSVFGDYIFRRGITSEHTRWSAGAAVELIPGIRITGRYFNKEYFTTGIEYSLGRLGLSSQARFNSSGYLYNTYGIRMGSYDRNIFDHFKQDNSFVEMKLLGGVKYQRFFLFDNSNTLKDLLGYIRAAANDKASSGIVLNLSGMNINREMVWELRTELGLLRSKGKKVYVYFDRTDMNGYHLASAADKIIIDPVGSLILEGVLFGRMYLTGALEKIGIGFNEIRNFRYKSAYETFSRKEMSDADEEQLGALVDNYYQLIRSNVCRSRGFTEAYFDSLLNNVPIFDQDQAVAAGLADTMARWDKIHDIVNKYENETKSYISPSSLSAYRNPEDNYWGEKPKIAIVYALGECAMDEGINARQLSVQLESVLKDPDVDAVVFRVDSPGGDGLASDLVAQKIKEYKYTKPVIVSQGYVAGSGGYWLSMYGDTIVSAPNTITGSVGVIAGWVYNKDLKEKLGISTDYVKEGRHADLMFGMRIPLIGISLPDRNLTDQEEEKFRDMVNRHYRDFVNKVAGARNLTYDEVHEVAQGRVWSGSDAKEKGLIDIIGNLNTAIDLAAGKSGLRQGEYKIIEFPEPGLFDLNIFMPKLLGIELPAEDPYIRYLKFRINNSGIPMPVLPLEFISGLPEEY